MNKMRKSFEELISGIHFHEGELVDFDYYQKEIILELMKVVRMSTIKECADKAEADWVSVGTSERAELFREENIECYVLKESILQLDKDSIEI